MLRLIQLAIALLAGILLGQRRPPPGLDGGSRRKPKLLKCKTFDVKTRTFRMVPRKGGRRTFGDVRVLWFPGTVTDEVEWEVRRGPPAEDGSPAASVTFALHSGTKPGEFRIPVVLQFRYGGCGPWIGTDVIGVQIDGSTITPIGGVTNGKVLTFAVAHFSDYAVAVP